MNPVVNGCQTVPVVSGQGTKPGMGMACDPTERAQPSDGRFIGVNGAEQLSNRLGAACKVWFHISSVRLKREEIQLVAVVALFGNVIVARKGLLQGHLLEQGD